MKFLIKNEFNIPNFENEKYTITETINFNYKDFKSIIRGILDELSTTYDDYKIHKNIVNNNKKLMDKSFTIFNFEKKRTKKLN